jgi:spore coat polysaccharide biosynthesis predicted glycosyltransferase SpsG
MNMCFFDHNRNFCDACVSALQTDDWNLPGHYEGTDYIIVSREYLAGHPQIKRRIKKVFVYIKNREAYEKINKILSGFDFHVTFMTHKKFPGIKDRVDYSENVAEILKTQDLSIVPMDFMLYQSLAAGIPTMILASNDLEDDRARRFAGNNSAIYMGKYKEITVNDGKKIIRNINLGIAQRKRLQYAGKKIVNKESCENVYKVFKQLAGI